MGTNPQEIQQLLQQGVTKKKLRVLIIEDEQDMIEILTHQVEELQIPSSVVPFQTGAEALDYMNKCLKTPQTRDSLLPHLILLDIFLPGEDGLSLLDRIKQDDQLRFIPVAVITSSSDRTHIREAYKRGSISFIRKPSHPMILQTLIHQLSLSGDLHLDMGDAPQEDT